MPVKKKLSPIQPLTPSQKVLMDMSYGAYVLERRAIRNTPVQHLLLHPDTGRAETVKEAVILDLGKRGWVTARPLDPAWERVVYTVSEQGRKVAITLKSMGGYANGR